MHVTRVHCPFGLPEMAPDFKRSSIIKGLTETFRVLEHHQSVSQGWEILHTSSSGLQWTLVNSLKPLDVHSRPASLHHADHPCPFLLSPVSLILYTVSSWYWGFNKALKQKRQLEQRKLVRESVCRAGSWSLLRQNHNTYLIFSVLAHMNLTLVTCIRCEFNSYRDQQPGKLSDLRSLQLKDFILFLKFWMYCYERNYRKVSMFSLCLCVSVRQ